MDSSKGIVIGIVIVFIVNAITIFLNANWIINKFIELIPEGIETIALNPMEVFTTYISLSCLLSFVIILPFIIYYSFKYFKDAMYEKEIKIVNNILFFGTVLFIMGFIFSFISFMKFGLEWFANFNVIAGIDTLWSLSETFNTVVSLCFIAGLIFESPMVLFLLIKSGIIDLKLDNTKRLIFLLGITLTIGLITPDGSLFTQVFLSAPIYLLTEGSIYLGNKYKGGEK